jgi:hypothetical protein
MNAPSGSYLGDDALSRSGTLGTVPFSISCSALNDGSQTKIQLHSAIAEASRSFRGVTFLRRTPFPCFLGAILVPAPDCGEHKELWGNNSAPTARRNRCRGCSARQNRPESQCSHRPLQRNGVGRRHSVRGRIALDIRTFDPSAHAAARSIRSLLRHRRSSHGLVTSMLTGRAVAR